jgi:hypothetical protein
MNLCGISPIPILITFLCCAALFVYFNLRLAEIKYAVEKQNKVLTAFISNVQQDIRCGGGGGNSLYNMSESSASASAQKKNEHNLASSEAMNLVRKIEVSDDEDESDSDSESESDSESDSEGDNEGDNEGENEGDNEGENDEKVIAQVCQQLNLNDIVQLTNMEMDNEHQHSSVSVFAFEVLGTSGEVHMPYESANATTSSISEITDETLSLDTLNTTQSYDSMKVDDLRTIVISQNLASKEDARKLKKPELLSLLKK